MKAMRDTEIYRLLHTLAPVVARATAVHDPEDFASDVFIAWKKSGRQIDGNRNAELYASRRLRWISVEANRRQCPYVQYKGSCNPIEDCLSQLIVDEILKSLPDERAGTILRMRMEGFTYREIEEETGTPKSTLAWIVKEATPCILSRMAS